MEYMNLRKSSVENSLQIKTKTDACKQTKADAKPQVTKSRKDVLK